MPWSHGRDCDHSEARPMTYIIELDDVTEMQRLLRKRNSILVNAGYRFIGRLIIYLSIDGSRDTFHVRFIHNPVARCPSLRIMLSVKVLNALWSTSDCFEYIFPCDCL